MSDPAKYRSKEEVNEYKERDPIAAIKSAILEKGVATQEELDVIDKKVVAIVKESVQFAEESPFPSPEDAYKDVYAEADYPFIKE